MTDDYIASGDQPPPDDPDSLPEAIVADLREVFLQRPNPAMEDQHVTAMLAAAGSPSVSSGHRRLLAGALVLSTLFLLGFGGLASAGELPSAVQDRVASIASNVGVDLPTGSDDEDPDDREAPGSTNPDPDPPASDGPTTQREVGPIPAVPADPAPAPKPAAPPGLEGDPGRSGEAPGQDDQPSPPEERPGQEGDPGRSGEAPGHNRQPDQSGPPSEVPGPPDDPPGPGRGNADAVRPGEGTP